LNEQRIEADARWSVAMAAAQDGDAQAYTKLLKELLPEVRRLVRGRLFDPSAVEDVVQNALLSIHRARHTYRREQSFGPWLRAIVRNATIDSFRQTRRRNEREVGGDVIDYIADPRPPDFGEGSRLSPVIAKALEELPDKQREAVEMIQLQGLSVAEAALRADVSVSALKVRAHRGYKALRIRLKGALE
jgi:RNA polymerase sigma-70 factor (ECF subfamily)